MKELVVILIVTVFTTYMAVDTYNEVKSAVKQHNKLMEELTNESFLLSE